MIRLALCALLVGCAQPEPPPVVRAAALPVVEQGFGPGLFDMMLRGKAFTASTESNLVLPAQIDPKRYRFLQVLELRRQTADRRQGQVAVAIDGWPIALNFAVARTPAGWRIVDVGPREDQQRWLDLLGPEGLPRARSAHPWRGGLAGRDASGRPTAAALLLALGQQLWVDGVAVGTEREAVVDALRRALRARTALAERLEVTYTPQVAIAVPRTDAASRHALLADWAVQAGAEGLLLVVRGPKGGPAALPLARHGPRPPGPFPPPLIHITRDTLNLTLTLGAQSVEVPVEAGLANGALAPVIKSLRATRPPPVGAVLEADFQTDHGRTVAFLDAWQTAAPDLPITTRRP
jgi:hypothetical protein